MSLKRAFEPLGKRGSEDVSNLNGEDVSQESIIGESKEASRMLNGVKHHHNQQQRRGFEPLGKRASPYNLDFMFQNLERRAFEPLGRK